MSLILAIRPDGRQSETAAAIQKGVCRHLRAHGFATLCEFTLASGRRADVVALGPRGDLWIIEIKSSREDFLADGKWPDYRDYCDRLYFAVTADMDLDLLPADTGLMVADAFDADILRHPMPTPLAGARRKALTIQFARAAALRLHGLHDPELTESYPR